MKKVKLDIGRLQLHKEKVINLTQTQMGQIHGGLNTNQPGSACITTHTCTTDFPGCVNPPAPACVTGAACDTLLAGCTGSPCNTTVC